MLIFCYVNINIYICTMNMKTIQKYKKYSTSKLIRVATYHFNKYIRSRDEGCGCISCSAPTFSDAGHFYPAGTVSVLRFNEHNVNGQCKQCNYYKHGNLIEYRKGLIEKIGYDAVAMLDQLVAIQKRSSFKWDRLELINIIEIYKNK